MTNDSDDNQPKSSITFAQSEEELDEKMVEIRLQRKEEEAEKKAQEQGFDYINLRGFPIGPEILTLIPEENSKRSKTIVFFKTDDEIRVAAMDPSNAETQEIVADIRKKYSRANVVLYLTSEHSFGMAFQLYKAVARPRKIERGVKISEEDLNKFQKEIESFRDLDKKVKEVSMTDLLTLLLASALKADSSDIHIEPEEKEIIIRFRIDGILQQVASLSPEAWKPLSSRVKIISGMKINVDNIPQDGRITVNLSNDKLEIRVSALPSAFGESIVMRLLKSSAASLEFDQLGIRGKAYEQLKRETERPNGMIVTTGPTGSGKTTTLYAILNKLNTPETKIITLENPVEYKLKGITQSQIDHSKDYTFAKGLRSILRQDPDIVMVGEIRDLETAEIAIQGALTGHLVVSTIHTNDAAGAIPRFMSMGVKPFLLAPALNAIIGQRLVRRICKECKEEIEIEPDKLERAKKTLSEIPESSGYKIDLDNLKFYHGKKCDVCKGIGYKGRVGIYEIFTMNKEIEDVILSGKVSEYQMRDIAVKYGMITMVQDGILKAIDGLTTVEEVFRVSE